MNGNACALTRVAAAVLAGWLAPVSAAAQAGNAPQEPRLGAAGVIDGPPPPHPPAVIRRDAQRNATIRAVELAEGIRLDGRLDERVYSTVPALTGFIQQAPDEGAPATEKTEAWILFNADNIYVAARVWDSAPPGEWVANEMRRDTRQLRQNDTFAVILDTFYDRRNGVAFYTNPLGAIADFAITNEGNPNSDWNPVWNVRTGRFEGGWTVEMEIPFKSLRYRPGPAQVWGVQLRRNVRRKNEWAYITQVPISAGNGPGGIFRVSAAATLVGIDAPSGSKNLELKPYAIGGVSTDLTADVPFTNEGSRDAGLDVKYGVTQNLTADFTFRTDFAQVEVDEQQVNLTRFPLFFPEKREFFLEGRGIFDFASGTFSGGGRGGLRRQGGGFFGGGNAPTIFYSRSIGLQNGSIVPILAGGRVTGKVGAFDVGLINMQADAVSDAVRQLNVASTNFTVVRLKRDILRRSSVGAIFTNRSISLEGDGSSRAYGIDANFSFYENVSFLAYAARTETPGNRGRDGSWQGSTTPATCSECRSNTWWSRTTSNRKWASCGATTSGAATAPCGTARAPVGSSRSGSSASRRAGTTSNQPAPAWSRRARRNWPSPRSSRTATGSESRWRRTTSSSIAASSRWAARSSRQARTRSAMSSSRTIRGRSGGSAAASPC